MRATKPHHHPRIGPGNRIDPSHVFDTLTNTSHGYVDVMVIHGPLEDDFLYKPGGAIHFHVMSSSECLCMSLLQGDSIRPCSWTVECPPVLLL